MTVAERKSVAASGANEYLVRPMRDREVIRAMLEARRPYAAYAIGQLDPRLFRFTEWWTADGPSGQALLLHSRGGLGNATLAMGEARALEAILRLHPGPRSTFLTCEPHHVETALRSFELQHRQTMIRMQVTADTFRPNYDTPVRRLSGRESREINALYRTEGVPSFYTPRQVDDSVYFGADADGALVAIAGTHVISSSNAIAVVGNVYTHPAYRGRHLAQAATSAVTERLLQSCRDVVLSGDPANTAAVRAYERLGYKEVVRLIEGAAIRRDQTGITAAIRRTLARARGRKHGGEIVRVQ